MDCSTTWPHKAFGTGQRLEPSSPATGIRQVTDGGKVNRDPGCESHDKTPELWTQEERPAAAPQRVGDTRQEIREDRGLCCYCK